MHYHLPDVLQTVTPLIEEAGAMLRREFLAPEGMRFEGRDALVDKEVERYLRDAITELYPEMGFRAEEEPEVNRDPKPGCDLIWLLDPHDGTRAASKGFRGASVSLGLIRQGVPVLGVVYAYAPPSGGRDLIAWAEGMPNVLRNGQPAEPRQTAFRVALVSKFADRRSESYTQTLPEYRYLPSPGIAYRLARVAAGDAEMALSLSVPRDFDCAGGHALLIGAGLELYDENGRTIRYSKGSMQQYGFCFGGDKASSNILAEKNWSSCRPTRDGVDCPPGLVEPSERALESDEERLNRAQGAWLGQLIGDALGSQVEFQSAREVGERWPHGVTEIQNGGSFNTLAGQSTDDSELATALAGSLIRKGCYDADAAALSYRAWHDSGPFDIGSTIRTALSAISQDAPSESAMAHALKDSQANGALMRLSPIGIAGCQWTEEQTINAARKDACLTHPHQVCVDANIVFAASIRHAVLTGGTPAQIYDHALAILNRYNLSPSVQRAVRSAVRGEPVDYQTQMGWVLIALQNAFYELLSEDSVETSLIRTVGRGGDTDTNACIAGALLGAAHGLTSLPARWVEVVLTCRPQQGISGISQPRPIAYWPVDALVVAERLLTIGQGERPG